MGDVVAREETERRAECRALGLVTRFAVHSLPCDKRVPRFRQTEHATVVFLPCRAEIRALDRRDRLFLGAAVCVKSSRLVPIPAPRRAFDAVRVEDAQIRGQSLELCRTRMLRYARRMRLLRESSADASADASFEARESVAT